MKTKIPSLIVVLIFTLITTLSWVGFSIYRAVISKPAPVISDAVSKELDPNLDSSMIEKLRVKIFITP